MKCIEVITMFRLERDFLPIGQGAFYAERIYIMHDKAPQLDKHIIFDCGALNKKLPSSAKTNLELIEHVVNEYFKKYPFDVDTLFISHLDEDHCNGVEYILKKTGVKTIVLPLLSEAAKMIESIRIFSMWKGVSSTTSSFLWNVLTDSYSLRTKLRDAHNNIPTIIWMKPGNIEQANEQNYLDVPTLSQDTNLFEVALDMCIAPLGISGTVSVPSWNEWIYKPFFNDYSNHRLIEDVNKKIAAAFGLASPKLTSKDLNGLMATKADRIKLREEYKKTVKSSAKPSDRVLHYYSMVLASYPNKNWCKITKCIHGNEEILALNYAAGCLYMGDYPAKDYLTEVQKYFMSFDQVGTLQIPHHGANSSYNSELLKLNFNNIVSHGYNYNHPGGDIRFDIKNNGKTLFEVTQLKDSALSQTIETV